MQFLVLKDESFSSVPDLLRGMMKQQEIGGLAVHWRVFGSSGHENTPKEGVLQVQRQRSILRAPRRARGARDASAFSALHSQRMICSACDTWCQATRCRHCHASGSSATDASYTCV